MDGKEKEMSVLRKRKEYGGYLPLELAEGEEYFSFLEEHRIKRYNSATTALYFAARECAPRRLLAPHYLCPRVKAMLAALEAEVVYYFLDSDLLPKGLNPKEGDCLLIVDYFGVMGKAVDAYAANFPQVIFDNSHAFYHPPVLREGAYNIYSCRKFFGVPDGGYLVAGSPGDFDAELSFSSERGLHLLLSAEFGTNYAYQEKLKTDELIGGERKAMSELTRRMLSALDYKGTADKRRANLSTYHRAFARKNTLSVEPGSVPYLYPFNGGKDVRHKLIGEKIYVPTLWKELLEEPFAGTLEQSLAKNTLFLPLDQRYGEEDVAFIIERVEAALYG